MDRRWARILTLWLLGVLAAAQLAKMSSLAPELRRAYGLSLPEVGLLISLLEVGGGLFGFVAGLAVGRAGSRLFLTLGLGLLAASGFAEALATAAMPLFVARGVEGIGYLLVVIAAPTMIAATADDRQRGPALALWSTFVPVGVAFGSALTGLAATLLSPRAILFAWALVPAALALVSWRLGPEAPRERAGLALPSLAAWLSTLSFGFFTIYVCSLTMLLPSFLIEQAHVPVSVAGVIAGIVSLAALPGSVIAVRALRAEIGGGRAMGRFVTPGLVATALLALAVFQPIGGVLVRSLVAIVLMICGGIAPPLVIARLPVLSGARDPHSPRIGAANGLLTQFGAGGALIGPPLGGLVVGWWGWPALGGLIAVLAIAMLVTLVLAETVHR